MAIVPLASILVVFGMLAGVLWWFRRLGIAVRDARLGRGRSARLEWLCKLPLGPQHTLHLVRLGETALLVASSPGGCALVRSFPLGAVDGRREATR